MNLNCRQIASYTAIRHTETQLNTLTNSTLMRSGNGREKSAGRGKKFL